MRTERAEAAVADPDLADPGLADRASTGPEHGEGGTSTLARRFTRVRDSAHALLPDPLRRWIPVTAVGFALLNGFTFSVDLALLWLLHQIPGFPYPAATTVAYIAALSLAYVLNRTLNFKSEKKAWPETLRYALTVAANYALFILGLNTLLFQHVGLPLPWPRLIAGAGEAVFMYCMMRWFVFRRPSA